LRKFFEALSMAFYGKAKQFNRSASATVEKKCFWLRLQLVIKLLVGHPQAQKLNKNGWTWRDLLYFLFVFILLTWTLSSAVLNERSALPETLQKKIVAILYMRFLFFYRKCEKCFSLIILSRLCRMSVNASKLHRTHVLTTSNCEIHLQNISKWFEIF